MSTTTVPFIITYQKSGAQAPVFLAGTFTNPEWQPQEMQSTIDHDGESSFYAQVSVEPGREYHFKFKVGSHDVWVVDESQPIVTDELGNKNNFLKVPIDHHPQPNKSLAKIKNTEPERSSTPIEQVARTAAEVADTAEKLDAEEFSTPPQVSASGGESENEDDLRTPLFAHECFGAYEFVDDALDHESYIDTSQRRDSKPKFDDYAVDEVDINDPTIEKFPEDKSSVLDTLRKIQSSLSEDRVNLDDLRVFSRRTSIDSDDSMSSAGSLSLSPVSTRRRENRMSTSSGRNRSLASLGSIAEEPKAGGGGDGPNPPTASMPKSKKDSPLNRARSPVIDEAETLMMRASRRG